MVAAIFFWFCISMGGKDAPIKDVGPFASYNDCHNAKRFLVDNDKINRGSAVIVLDCHGRVQ